MILKKNSKNDLSTATESSKNQASRQNVDLSSTKAQEFYLNGGKFGKKEIDCSKKEFRF